MNLAATCKAFKALSSLQCNHWPNQHQWKACNTLYPLNPPSYLPSRSSFAIPEETWPEVI
jgi:hypothetical protein